MVYLALVFTLIVTCGVCRVHVTDFTCPDNWLDVGQSCVHFSLKAANWTTANKACHEMNSSLIIVSDAETDDKLNDIFQYNESLTYSHYFWTGHYSKRPNSTCSIPWHNKRMENLIDHRKDTKHYCQFIVPKNRRRFYNARTQPGGTTEHFICQRVKTVRKVKVDEDRPEIIIKRFQNEGNVSTHNEGLADISFTADIFPGDPNSSSFKSMVEPADTAGHKLGNTTDTVERKAGITTFTVERKVGITTENVERNVGITTENVERNVGITTDNVARNVGITTDIMERKVGISTDTVERNVGITTDTVERKSGITTDNVERKAGNTTDTVQHQTLNTTKSESNTIHSDRGNYDNKSPDDINVMGNEDHPNTDLILPVSVCTAILFIAIFVAVVCLCQKKENSRRRMTYEVTARRQGGDRILDITRADDEGLFNFSIQELQPSLTFAASKTPAVNPEPDGSRIDQSADES